MQDDINDIRKLCTDLNFSKFLYNSYIEPYTFGTEEEQIAAIDINAKNIMFVYNPSEELQLLAISKNPEVIKYINNPSEIVQLSAISIEPKVLEWISNPTESVQELYLNNFGFCSRITSAKLIKEFLLKIKMNEALE